MTTSRIYLPKSRAHQREVLLDTSRFKVVVCGRRWNKTDAAFQAIVLGHGPRRGFFPGLIDGAQLAWVVPVANNAVEVWAMLKKSLAGAWIPGGKSEKERRIQLPNGGSVTVITTKEQDNIRSRGYDGMVCDEVAFMKPPVWKVILRPMLVDREGWVIFITTPNGRNWFHRDIWNLNQNRLGWRCWQLPTSNNPFISEGELRETLLDLGPHLYAQEHGAQFITQEGAEFPPEWFGPDIWFDEWPDSQDIYSTVIALDPSLGRTDKSDYSAYVIMKRHKSGRLYCDADLERRVTTKMVSDGIRLAKQHMPQAFGVESVAFQSLLLQIFQAQSKKAGLMLPLWEVSNSKPSKEVRIRRLTPYLSRGEILFKRDSPGAEMMVEQLQAFPVAEHDDGPDALEMAHRITYDIWSHEPPREEETKEPVRFKG